MVKEFENVSRSSAEKLDWCFNLMCALWPRKEAKDLLQNAQT
jgi:hypothetical protein